MFDPLNQFLFALLNAAPGLAGWRLHGAVFAAEWVILIVPIGLVLMWAGGGRQRDAAVHALLAAVLALTMSKIIGLVWFHPRPFMLAIGQNFLHHAPDSSFLSDHATSMFSVALALLPYRLREARRCGMALLALSMVAALVVSSLAALLANTRAGAVLARSLVALLESVYRRVLARPIARGWLRP